MCPQGNQRGATEIHTTSLENIEENFRDLEEFPFLESVADAPMDTQERPIGKRVTSGPLARRIACYSDTRHFSCEI